MKKIIALLFCILLVVSGCSAKKEDEGEQTEAVTKKITIAYQYGLAYAPAAIVKEKNLLVDAYKELSGNDLEVEWVQMSSGADINNGIAAGEIAAGFMGVAPAITGISKGFYKIFTNISGQQHGMMSNDADINSLADLVGSEDQIALVNIGSIQHIILAKALAENGFDAHALDSNIVAMKHPDGMTALESGSVKCHLTSSPYIFYEHDNEELHEINEVNMAWGQDKSFIVGVAAAELVEDQDLYNALCNSLAEAIDLINNDVEAAAALTHEFDKNTLETEIDYLQRGVYTVETNGLLELLTFMKNNGFCETEISSYEELVYDNVKGN